MTVTVTVAVALMTAQMMWRQAKRGAWEQPGFILHDKRQQTHGGLVFILGLVTVCVCCFVLCVVCCGVSCGLLHSPKACEAGEVGL